MFREVLRKIFLIANIDVCIVHCSYPQTNPYEEQSQIDILNYK